MKGRVIFLALLATFLLGACGESVSQPSASTNKPIMKTDQTIPPAVDEQIAIIETNKGTIKMKFFPQYAPETVKNFVELAKKGFFNNLTFHRVIPGFMIQGGDPKGTGLGGESYKGPNTTIPGEVNPVLSHIKGAVSMANKGGDPNTATSQFFIVQNKDGATMLDGGYTIFGQVFEGLDIIDAIATVTRDANDKPKTPVIMKKVTIK